MLLVVFVERFLILVRGGEDGGREMVVEGGV